MRLIDFHLNWLLQYAPETTVFDPNLYPGIEGRLGQLQGYLQTTRAAIFSCSRTVEDWGAHDRPWVALGQLLARIEAEFPGRLLIGPEDFGRFQEDREGLTWGMIGVSGFEALIRSPEDLDHLPALFARGVRVFQLEENAGASPDGHSFNLLDSAEQPKLGLRLLDAIEALANPAEGPVPLIDLSGLDESKIVEVLNWFEATPHPRRSIPILSRYATAEDVGGTTKGLTHENLGRLRSLGGYLGLDLASDSFEKAEQIKEAIHQVASLPFRGRLGVEGIGISSRFLARDRTLPGLGTAEEVARWFQAQFDRTTAKDLLHDNGLALISLALGVKRPR